MRDTDGGAFQSYGTERGSGSFNATFHFLTLASLSSTPPLAFDIVYNYFSFLLADM
jgi:hypothetical protein